MSSTEMTTLGRPGAVPVARTGERVFFSALAWTMALLTFIGFAPSYFLRSHAAPALSPLVQLHGAVFAAWMVLLVTQTSLIAPNRVDLHRRLGVAGVSVAALVLAFGVAVTASAWERAFGALSRLGPYRFPDAPVARLANAPVMEIARAFPDSVFALGFMNLAAFGVLFGVSIWLRRRTDIHKRLVLIATTELLSAPIGRIAAGIGFGQAFALADLFIVAMALHDLATTRRLNPATLWGGALVIAVQPLQLLATQSALSHGIMAWIVGH